MPSDFGGYRAELAKLRFRPTPARRGGELVIVKPPLNAVFVGAGANVPSFGRFQNADGFAAALT